ncbi:hypothetical protein ESB00_03890 [Oleiharenicola lentus]|uniref:Replication-associated protein ORF2/G2P domain-containing protein n=1 Tax=Oleiharenicola lentus TaxID=2508720 RepID=A0A4Q1C889_9BACT|nr:hypothetical protein [Oleiharenicola lentus]RXK55051.1 hypothetical protein ESB00_03890 [Oleiharenicola lentus]
MSALTESVERPPTERAELAAGCGREAPAPAPAGLPCQNSNNSDKPRYKLKPVPHQPGIYRDNSGKQLWDERDEDTLYRWGVPTGAEARSAFHLRLNVAAFIQHWGRNHCLFFTVTDEANLHPTQFARRWNSYLRRNGAWILSFIRVLEPQKRGNPHYHLLVAVEWDTRPDAFDWPAFDLCQRERRMSGTTGHFRELRLRYRNSAAPGLVAMWSLLRKVLPRYGLGRAELLPIRKGKEAISEYIGKYLEAGLVIKKHSWKGCRRVEFDRRNKIHWLACTRVFAWHSPGMTEWRQRVAAIAAVIGAVDMPGITRILGRSWAYRLRDCIVNSSAEEFTALLQVLGMRAIPRIPH